ncbi:MarR family winged helix-turn-helix transcriptional regulator [Raoultibacter massiliensis]|uniref:MarR family winged helix-turn-helix transcriptional regulator n=1 Tax=Raoultibacter massiliensis TaxID=1852371 RepID=A0ABV1JEG0_9ACTN|nr:MarR family winged helix-turn-helix transcriptional regulator [Raoultibacter massiliensis]
MIDNLISSFEQLHESVEEENRVSIGPYTGRQLMMLSALSSFDSAPTLGEFADHLRCSYQNVRVLVSLLEEQGCVHAKHDPADGRRLRIELTDDGKALTRRVNAHLDAAKQRYTNLISEEDIAAFIRVTDAIVEDEGYIKTFAL